MNALKATYEGTLNANIFVDALYVGAGARSQKLVVITLGNQVIGSCVGCILWYRSR